MASEYNVDVTFEPVAFTGARWALAGWDAVDEAIDANQVTRLRPDLPPCASGIAGQRPDRWPCKQAKPRRPCCVARSLVYLPNLVSFLIRQLLNVKLLSDTYGRPVLLFPSEWRLNTVATELGESLRLRPHALAPDVEEKRRKKR